MSTAFLLVVEDDPLLLDTYCLVLEEAGFAVECAGSAAEAEGILQKSAPRVRALITDIRLGASSMNGWQLAERARAIRDDLPVIYLTGGSEAEPDDRLPDTAVLSKPFTGQELLNLVRKVAGAA